MGLGLGFLGGLNGNGIGGIGGLMGADDASITAVTGKISSFISILNIFVMGMAALIMVCYAVWIGFKFMKAEDDGKRKEAKTHLIYCVIGFVSMSAMALVFGLLNVGSFDASMGNEITGLQEIYDITNQVVSAFLGAITSLATMFALYVGWKFVAADDESKRKNAKTQLIYTFIGIVAIFGIRAIAMTVLNGLGGAVLNK
jgi:heme/copper-type cytochrome/quinol oxidase subunit 2